MADIKNIPRNWVLAGSLLVISAVVGAMWGSRDLSTSQADFVSANAQKNRAQDTNFALPPGPPAAVEKTDVAVDLEALRIWEIAARQPLPPRKEPLTPPDWKIVGVSSAGNEKYVMILFANQTTAEVLKVGDKLPGGVKIVDITQDHLRLVLNGQPIKLSLSKQ